MAKPEPLSISAEYHRAGRRGIFQQRIANASVGLALVFGSILFMLPLYVMVSMSLKSKEEIALTSPWSWPINPTFENYRLLFEDRNFAFWLKFFNTFILSAIPTIGVTLTAAMVAYPFARLNFRGRDRLFIILLSTMMLPGVVTMIPGYVLMAKLHWIDTFLPFIVPAFFGGGAFNIFLLRQFLKGIPREMDEAAKLDGASHARIFWQMLIPNSGPALATIAVFTFIGSFRDFMGPLMMLNDPNKQTLEVALRSLQNARGTEWHLLMAGSVLVMIPMVIIFLACQRYFVKGITLTGGK
jgi:ABC-type glycerol-3-phosphate transport system permease component